MTKTGYFQHNILQIYSENVNLEKVVCQKKIKIRDIAIKYCDQPTEIGSCVEDRV